MRLLPSKRWRVQGHILSNREPYNEVGAYQPRFFYFRRDAEAFAVLLYRDNAWVRVTVERAQS